MDDIEMRVSALETAVVQLFSHLNSVDLAKALLMTKIGGGMDQTDEEFAIRLRAAKLIEDAQGRVAIP
jgi:hypothetical protein